MSDTATTEELPAEIKEELEKIVTTTKKGFNLQARVKGRGLRKGTITLFLDEELGPELGWAQDLFNAIGEKIGRDREGVVGELDALEEEKAAAIKKHETLAAAGELMGTEERVEPDTAQYDKQIAALETRRDELLAELTKTAIVVSMRAVPPVIKKDCRRLARETLKIEQKGIPEDKQEDYEESFTAHLMTKMIQSVTDNETGEVNAETSYEDALVMLRELPEGQLHRLDLLMGKIQYTDAISRQIEGQEDFS